MKDQPFSFQQKLLDEIKALQNSSNKPIVLAASCGSGKTFMSINFIESFLKLVPTAKVLVLTHGQTLLRNQYAANVKKQDPKFSHKEVEKGKDLLKFYKQKQVIIAIPQAFKTLKKNMLIPHFDLLVVDEAHQRYFAEKEVQSILKQSNPTYQLLLTGTPSPFIARNTPTKTEFNILTLPMSRLLEEEAITDVLVELASTTYPISGEDYNQEGNLKENFKFEDLDTITTLDKLLDKIHKRLKSVIKNNPTLYSALSTLSNWVSVLNSLEKTMFACHSQEQARQVASYFKSKGINVALSTSDDDLEAEEVDRFINDKKCAVLIVVGRGVLGFNFEELVNVVDMTGSQNIDRIFQLMARVVRKHPKGYKKLFFKIVPKTMASYFEHLMTGVLCLTCEEWYTKYNGHNFLQLPLPIRKNNKVNGPRIGKNNKGPKQKPKPIEYVGLPAIQLFNDITHKDNSEFNSYEFVTLGEVREKLLGIETRDNNPKEHIKILNSWLDNHKFEGQSYRPSKTSKDPEELLMLNYFLSLSHSLTYLEFSEKLRNIKSLEELKVQKKCADLLTFVRTNQHRPSKKDSELGIFIGSLINGSVAKEWWEINKKEILIYPTYEQFETEHSLLGKRFGKLLVISFSYCKKGTGAYWLCKCDCGKEKIIPGQQLKRPLNNRPTKSCGCLQKEKVSQLAETTLTTHGLGQSHLASKFNKIRKTPTSVDSKWLGKDWFKNVENDLGPYPGKDYTIERKDPNGIWNRENCRWVPINNVELFRNSDAYIGTIKENNRVYWYFNKKINGKNHRRQFTTKDEAIEYRDKFLKENGLL